jgi:hypothetical protein
MSVTTHHLHITSIYAPHTESVYTYHQRLTTLYNTFLMSRSTRFDASYSGASGALKASLNTLPEYAATSLVTESCLK